MATEIAFSASVEVGEGAKSLKSLRQEFKETQKELDGLNIGSQEYINTLKKLGGIKDEIGDLNDEINAFKPEGKIQAFSGIVAGVASGFEAATGAVALFGGESEDLQKTLLKVQSAMAFAEGIKGLVGIGDAFVVAKNALMSFSLGQKIVTAAQWLWNEALLANPITAIITGVVALTGAIYALVKSQNSEEEKQQRLNELQAKWNEENEKTIEGLKRRQALARETNDFELALLKATGATRDEVFKKEIENLKKQSENYETIRGQRGNLLAEEINQQSEVKRQLALKEIEYTQFLKDENIKKAKDREELNKKFVEANEQELKDRRAIQKVLDDDFKKFNEARLELEKQAAEEKRLADEKAKKDKEAQDEQDYNNLKRNILAGAELRALKNEDDLNAQLAFLEAKKNNELLNTELTENEKLVIAEKYAQQKKELTEKYQVQELQTGLEIAKKSAEGLQSLSDAFFAIKMANVKKGSKEEEAAAKKQFKINKALAIQSTIISGIQGVVNALSAQSVIPEPYGTILKVANAVAVGIATAANVAKISATQFDAGGGGGAASSIAAVDSTGASAAAPTLNAPSSGSTILNPDGTVSTSNQQQQQQPIQAYVVESQVTQVQGNVHGIEQMAVH